MAAIQIGDGKLIFGTTDETYGLMDSIDFEVTAQVSEAMDGDGDIVNVEHFGKKTTCSASYIFKTTSPQDADEPTQRVGTGVKVTLANSPNFPAADKPGDLFVHRAKESFKKADWKVVDFDCTFYPSLSTP